MWTWPPFQLSSELCMHISSELSLCSGEHERLESGQRASVAFPTYPTGVQGSKAWFSVLPMLNCTGHVT